MTKQMPGSISTAWSAAHEISRSPWERPAGLSTKLDALGHSAFLPLGTVVTFLAFGEITAPEGLDPLQEVARRSKAAKVLFAAARDGHVKLFGKTDGLFEPRQISAVTFATPHALASQKDGIEIDLAAASMEAYADLREKQEDARRENKPAPSRWLDVCVDRASLASWLLPIAGAVSGTGSRPLRAKKPTKLEQAAEWLRENFSEPPSANKKELIARIGRDAPHIGAISERRLTDALSLAFSKK